jgi:hypothetical protein
MWVIDDSAWAANQCNYTGFVYNSCWIEGGVKSFYNGRAVQNYFFWADLRPCGGKFAVHYAGLSDSQVGNITQYTFKANSLGTTDSCNDPQDSSWLMNALSWGGCCGTTQFNGYSTRNPILPDWVATGGELQGVTNESEGTAHENNVQYEEGSSWSSVTLPMAYNESTPWTGNPWNYNLNVNNNFDTVVSCGC